MDTSIFGEGDRFRILLGAFKDEGYVAHGV